MRKKSFKSALTVLLSLMMILVMFPANAFAMDGEGTKENPYEIATASDLYEFATKVNAGDNTACAVLTADITLIDTNWTPIGNDSNQYKGTFDGDGHTITGLKVDIQSDNIIYAGLFGCLGAGGTIKNVSLTDSKITCSGNRVYAGGVCGWNTGTIQNCYNTGDVSGTSEYGFVYAGGVCGLNDYGTIENCYNTGDVSGTCEYGFVYAGGVCGCNDFGTIQNCYNTGDVSGTGTRTDASGYAGGVCGCNDFGTIENCYNTGEVSGTGTSTDGSGYAGGVCGWNTGTIENCYFLFGTADKAVSINSGTVDNVEEKSAEAFASGEVAWLLNEPQTEKPWGQGSNGMPVLKGNLPDGVTSYVPVRITIVMQDNSEQYRYTTEGSTVAEYPTGYAFFFKDGDTKTWISKGTRTYDADATIYAENMPLEKIQAKAPTCTEDGNSAYWYSAAFDKYFKDENGVNEITAESTVIPATGHNLTNIPAIAPTCTEAGNIEYWYCDTCDKYFCDETATDEIALADTVLEATGHSYENGKCTVCGEIDPDFKAVIIEGANGSWQKGTKDGLSFTSNAAFAHFLKVQVDGKDLDASDYAVKEGSTIVTLKAEYLETLSVGRHTLAIVSDTGTATAEFTIEAASADDNTTVVPPTGDNSNVDLWIALMLVSVCGISMATVYSRRKKYNH